MTKPEAIKLIQDYIEARRRVHLSYDWNVPDPILDALELIIKE